MTLPPILTQEPDGEIHVTGHRIGLFTLVKAFRQGWSAERTAEEYPSLTPEKVQKVLDFYRENRAEAEAYADVYEAELERQYAEWTPTPGVLQVRRWLEMVRMADAEHLGDPEWEKLDVRAPETPAAGSRPPCSAVANAFTLSARREPSWRRAVDGNPATQRAQPESS